MSRGNMWRLAGWGVAVAIILAPLVAMQLDAPGVNWTLSDFIFAIVLIGSVGLLFELGVRASGSWAYRGGVAMALAAGFLTIWINLAVGIVGNEDNPINLAFMVVVLLAIAGAIVARGKAELMTRAMLVPAPTVNVTPARMSTGPAALFSVSETSFNAMAGIWAVDGRVCMGDSDRDIRAIL